MRYLLDTDWLIDALVGIPEAVATLLTRNRRHFERIPGLRLYQIT